MLDVVRDAGRVAVPPLRENLEGVGDLPVVEALGRRNDAGFFGDFAACRVDQPLVVLLAAGHRLPETGVLGAFEQQHVERRRINDDEDGDRPFVAAHDAAVESWR